MDKVEKVLSNLAILRTWAAVNPSYGMGLSVDDCRKAVTWLDEAIALLDEQRVRAKHGQWIEENDRERHWHCSECGTVWGLVHRAMKYCPNCGTIMGGGGING